MKPSLRFLLPAFVALTSASLSAATATWDNSSTDQSWSDQANWDIALVPGVASQPVGFSNTTSAVSTVGYDVVIGPLSASANDNTIIIDTANFAPGTSSVSIGSMTFNDTHGVTIGNTGSESLTVTGNITNNVAGAQTFATVSVIAGANATYAGGPAGGSLNFQQVLNVQTFQIQTSGLVTVSGLLNFTINSNTPGGYGTIGPINAAGATISADGAYTGAAGNFFQLSTGSLTGATVSTSDLPTLSGGLVWVTSLIQKGILLVQNTNGNIINTGVTLPIDNDAEFNTGGITFNGGELVTNNNGDASNGTPFATSRAVGVNTVGGTIAASNGTTATYNGVIANGNGSTGALQFGDSTHTGTIVLTGANTFGGEDIVSANTTLKLSGSGKLGGSSVAVSLAGGTLDLNGTTQSVDIVSFGGGATLKTSGAASTINIATGANVLAGSNTLASGVTLVGTTDVDSGASLALNGAVTGTVAVAGTLSGTGTVTGNALVNSGTITGTGLRVTGTSTFINANNSLGGTVTSNIAVSSGGSVTQIGTLTGNVTSLTGTLTANGTITGSTTFASGGRLQGTGTVGLVTLVGNDTLLSSGTLHSGGITVGGSGNLISSGIVSGNITINNAGVLNIASGATASGTVGVNSGGILKGLGTTGAVTLAGGGGINLQDGVIGTLTVGGLSLGNAGTPSILAFDIGAGGSGNLDKITDTGALTLNGANGTTINIGNVSGSPTLTTGTYTLISYTGSAVSLANLHLGTTSLDGQNLSLALGSNTVNLVVSTATSTIATTYTLSTTPAATRIIKGQSTTLTTTITNTGSGSADSLNFTGLGASGTGVAGSTTSGGPVSNGGGTGTNSGQTFSSATVGAHVLTPVVATATNSNIGGAASATGTTTATVSVLNNRTEAATTVALGRVLVGQSTGSQNTTISSATNQDSSLTRTSIGAGSQTVSVTNGTVTLAGGSAYQFGGANDATNSTTRGVTGVFTTAGNQTGTATITPTGEGLTGETVSNVGIGYTADAVNKRVITTGTATNFGLLHTGATVTGTSSAFTSATAHTLATDVTVAAGSGSADANGVTLSGASTLLNGTTTSGSRVFGGTITGSGATTGTFALGVTGEGLTGEGSYSNVNVVYTANVYTGQSVWAGNGTSTGSWGTPASGFGANWGAGQGSPGLDANFTSTDSATFNTIGGQATQTVTLDGANPSLNAITFNAASTSYTLAKGTSGTITLNGGGSAATLTDSAGNHTISAGVKLATNANVAVSSGQQLTLSGAITGTGGLTFTGAGTTILSGADTYSGLTSVNAGRVSIKGTMLSTGTISVGNGGTLTGTGTAGRVSVSGGGNLNLQDGAIGTLTVAGLTLGNAGTPSILSFDIGAGTSGNLDKIVDTGALTLNGAGGTTINIGNVSGSPTLSTGTYTLISYTGSAVSLSNLTLGTNSLDGMVLSLSLGANSVNLVVGTATATFGTTYNLTTTAGSSRIISGQSTGLTTTITNTGSGSADGLNFTGLGATGTTVSGSTTNGGPVAASGSASNSGQTFSDTTTGAHTITTTVGTATNATLGGNATLGTATNATVAVVDDRTESATAVNFGRVIVGQSITGSTTISSVTGQDSSLTRVTLGAGVLTATGVSNGGIILAGGPGGASYQFGGANDATNSTTRNVTGSFTTAGTQNGTAVITPTGEGLAGESVNTIGINYTVDPVTKRVITNGAVTDFGALHNGVVINTTSDAFTTSGTHDTTTDVTVAAGSGTINGITLSGGATTFNGTTSSDTRNFTGTLTNAAGGVTSGTFQLAVTGEGLAGEGTYQNVSVTYTSFVYTGQGVWTNNGSGNWGPILANPFNWTAIGGVPGLDPSFRSTDSATFGPVLTSGTAIITLDGDNPNLRAITFNDTAGSYNISQGTSGSLFMNGGAGTATISDVAGSHTISAPMEFDTNVAATISRSTDTLTLSGDISEGGTPSGLTVNGPGTVVVSGSNSYTGTTTLSSGRLAVTGAGTLGANTAGLTVAAGTLDLGATTQTVGAVRFTGASTIQNGTISSGSSFAVSAAGTTTVNAALAGAASLTKTGAGALALNGANSFSGGTTISAGIVNVGNTSALGTGDVHFSGGTLQAANGVHQINVGGNYTQTGGLLVLNLTGTTPGASPGYEFLNVGGTAALGGALKVNVSSPYVPVQGDTFTFVQAGSITGGFTNVSTNLASLSITVQGAGSILTVNQLPFATLPGINYSSNQKSVATYIDQSFNAGSATPAFQTLLASLNSLTSANASPTSLPSAFEQLTEEKFTNFIRTTVINNASFTTQLLDGYLDGQRGPDGTFIGSNGEIDSSGLTIVDPSVDPGIAQIRSQLLAWSPSPLSHGMLSDSPQPILGGIDTKRITMAATPDKGNDFSTFVMGNAVMAQNFSQEDVAHSDSTTGAVQIGASYRINPNIRVGAVFGYGHTDASLDNIGSKATVDSYAPGAFLSFAEGGWYLNAIGSYGFNNYTQDRMISFGGLSGDAHGAPSGDQVVGNLDGGYDFHMKDWTFGPTLGVQYTHVSVDAFSEDGLDPVDLNVDKQETDSLRSRLGGHVSYGLHTGKVLLTPHVSASWQHEFLDDSRGITSQFIAVGAGSFTINTPRPSRDSALLDCGLTADLNGQVSLYLDYLAQVGQSDYFGQSVQAGVKVGF